MHGTRRKSLRNPHKVFGENNFLLKVADGAVEGFGLVVAVEGEGVVVGTKPRVAVAEVPEGDAIDFVGVAAHDAFHAHKRSRF